MHPSRVLLPLRIHDSERALALAADVASGFEVTLDLFAAVEDPHEVASAEGHLEELRRVVHRRHPQLPIDADVVVDPHAPDAIAARADDLTLPVMATSARPFIHAGYLGSAAEHVIRRTHRPVLMVGPKVDPEPGLSAQRIMVPIDGSAAGEASLDVAGVWAARLELPLWVVAVVESKSPPVSSEAGSGSPEVSSSRLRDLAARHDARWEILHASSPAPALASAAGTDSLVIMSSHGRSGIRRLALGSVAADLTRRASCPVMVVASNPGENARGAVESVRDRRPASLPGR